MVKDPFYRQILRALDGSLEGNLFERCVCDLLRERFTLVPMTGGHDGGVDGEIADGEGEAFPLICTTQNQVIDNLTGSLKSNLRTGGQRRKVVVATSRALSPPRRRNLRDRARKLGFTLVQVYEQRAMAALLYRNPEWCQDLLGLSGKPEALSVLPPSLNRPFVELELLGRDKDMEWLRGTARDRVLVGGPGVGKTYLLYRLALDGWGLFLASDDEAEIGNAIRDQKPDVIVVDDAHADPGRLERLAALRRRISARFSIVATTWKGRREDVAAALNVPEARVRTLEPLFREQIRQILEELGVEAADEELLELVDQASNKPGLATTLAAFWLEGDWLSVLRGETLARDTLRSVRRLLGRDEQGLLAVFSLGGRCGMSAKGVGEKRGLDALEVWERLSGLTSAGVLSDQAGGDFLVVQPRALRSVLLSSVFFAREGPSLDYRDYLDLASGYDCAAREVVVAASRGARIATEEMQRLLERLDPAEHPFRREAKAAWATFVGLGHQEALWAFEHYPGDFADIALPGLFSAPGITIGKLLKEAEVARRQGTSRPQLHVLQRWLYEITEETIERRRIAIRAAREYAEAADSAGAHEVAFSLACLTLRPTLEEENIDPTRTALVSRRGPLSQAQTERMKGVWQDALQLFKITGVASFPELSNELGEWLRLASFRGRSSEDDERFIRQLVIEMLQDLTHLAAGREGLVVALVRFAGELGAELHLDPDPRLELLFPEITRPTSENLTSEPVQLHALVGEWADSSPREVVDTLVHLTREAASIPFGYYDKVSDVCRLLAARTRQPPPWFEELIARQVPSSWLEPFLERLIALGDFDDRIRTCLRSEAYAEIGVRSVLRLSEPLPDLLDMALARAVDFPSVVWQRGLSGQLATPVAEAILAHPDPALALAMAFGEWRADPHGQVRPELEKLWRQAVLRCTELVSPKRIESHQLTDLLGSDPELAYEWLLRLDASDSRPGSEIRSVAETVIGFLTPERRGELLEGLLPGSVLVDYLPQMIGHDVKLFRRLLRREALADFHMVPLRGLPESDWADLAKLALDEGWEPKHVALAAYSTHHTMVVWRGTVEKYWRRWDEAFAALDRPVGTDSGWQEMIRRGREEARRRILEAESQSQHIEREGMPPLADPS